MKTILRNLSDDRLRAYIVWLPTLKSDNQAQAEIRITEFADTRLRYFWDGHNATGTLWQGVLGLKVVPWDIYLLYSLSTQWEKAPAAPDYWMHQLGDEKINGAPRLDRAVFESKLKKLLNSPKHDVPMNPSRENS